MIVLIDNYDSFSYNLYQMIGTMEPDIKVVRNDELTVEQLKKLNPGAIILSPGPGRPTDAGICIEAVKQLKGKVKILGVCLGHQAICEAFDGTVTYAKKLMHGKQSEVTLDTESVLFQGLGKQIKAARYHSLAASKEQLPECFKITAMSLEDDEIMAVEHKEYPIYGVQFHPESILTLQGAAIIENFLKSGRNVK